jgi:hypothetical protein
VPKVGRSIKKGQLTPLHPISKQNLKVLKEMKSIQSRIPVREDGDFTSKVPNSPNMLVDAEENILRPCENSRDMPQFSSIEGHMSNRAMYSIEGIIIILRLQIIHVHAKKVQIGLSKKKSIIFWTTSNASCSILATFTVWNVELFSKLSLEGI